MRAAIYARVSTDDQDWQIQIDELRDFARRWDWETTEYTEKLSGKEGNHRPELDRLLADAAAKRFDLVLVWKLDRFGRSTLDTLTNVKTLDQYGVRFRSLKENIDTDNQSPTGKFILTIFAAVAELERSFILQRTAAGHRAYRKAFAAGKIGKAKHSKSGKDLAVGRPRKIFPRDKAIAMRDQGMSWRQIEKALGVSNMTIRRVLKQVA